MELGNYSRIDWLLRRGITSILFVICSQGVFATDFFVSISGNDATGNGSSASPWRTLRFAVTRVAANQNHTIRVSAGTFVESGPFTVPQGVNIDGAGIDQTIIKAASSFYYYPASPGFGTDKFLINLNDPTPRDGNQSLKNFTVDGDGKKLHGGIMVYYRNKVTIENVKVQGTNFSAIWLWGVKNSALRKVTLLNCAWASTGWASGALNLGAIENVELDGLYVDENVGYGVKAIGPSGNKISYLIMHDSHVSVIPAGKWNNGAAPNISIELWSVDLLGCEIYDSYVDNHISLVNQVYFPPNGLKTIRVHHNIIDLQTRAGGTGGYGLELSLNNAEVDHNYFFRGNYAIVNWGGVCRNWDIHHNVFYGIYAGYPSETLRAQVSGFHSVKYYNNTIEMIGTKTSNVMTSYGGSSDNVEIKNNLIINSNTSYSYYPNQLVRLDNGATMTGLQVQNNFLQNLPLGNIQGTYSNNLSGDPKINKTGARPTPYYLPLTGSPLIDAGINVGLPFEGNAPDIGAYEFSSGTPPPSNVLPQVALTSPTNNSTHVAGSALAINATASDSDGSISRVEFFSGTTKLGEDLSSPYSFTWNNVPAGNYTLTARATDNQSGITTSVPISITVSNANTPPIISLTSPANNALFYYWIHCYHFSNGIGCWWVNCKS